MYRVVELLTRAVFVRNHIEHEREQSDRKVMTHQSFIPTTFCLFAMTTASCLAQHVLQQSDGVEALRDASNEAPTSVLAIGISQFENMPNLVFTTNDAVGVSRAFREVGGLPKDNVTTLVDTPESEASRIDRATLLCRMSGFLAKRKKGDTAVLFFSGHGYQGESSF